ncbi:MAG: hypothetical protein ACYSUP_16020 [Planctomycetota bacterium]
MGKIGEETQPAGRKNVEVLRPAKMPSVEAVNRQLRAREQQLKAANQQLRAHEQQLQAANQQLQAREQQLGLTSSSCRPPISSYRPASSS